MKKTILGIAIVFVSLFMIACTDGYLVTFETLQLTLKQINEDTSSHYIQKYNTLTDAIERKKEYNNRLKTIECVDNDQKPYELVVTAATILTVTKKKGIKVKYFLDTIHLESDSIMVGKVNREVEFFQPTRLNEITKIEVWTYTGMN